MIEIVGGPHDGNTYKRRPPRGATIFLTAQGFFHLKPQEGDEALMEIGVCANCGARIGPNQRRKFAPLPLALSGDSCQLCGETREERHEHHE